MGSGKANARPNAKFANAPRQARDWQGKQMPRSGPGGGGGGTWAHLDSAEALCSDSAQENFANKLSGIE